MSEPLPARVRWARRLLALVASAFVAGLLGQIYLAGLAVFAGPGHWQQHRDFVHTFEWLSPIAVILVYVARARGAKWLAWITMALISMQYTTADWRLTPARQTWAALHPVNAALLVVVAAELARRTWRLTREV